MVRHATNKRHKRAGGNLLKNDVDRLVLNETVVEIHYDKAGDWKKDKVYICLS